MENNNNLPIPQITDDPIPEIDLLTLSPTPNRHPTTTIQPRQPHFPFINIPIIPDSPPQNYPVAAPPFLRSRGPGNYTGTPSVGNPIPAPFPWSGNCRATVRSMDYLRSQQIVSICGDVQCRRCEHKYKMEFHLEQKFYELANYIAENKRFMYHRAPRIWLSPTLPTCQFCNHANSVKPLIAAHNESINWLFLLLGKMVGCCTLEQLKYLCQHTKNHRTGAKDRVLYLAYMELCRQVDPSGPFDI